MFQAFFGHLYLHINIVMHPSSSTSFLSIPAAVCGILDSTQHVYSILQKTARKSVQTGNIGLAETQALGKNIINLRFLFMKITPTQKERLELVALENLMVITADLVIQLGLLEAILTVENEVHQHADWIVGKWDVVSSIIDRIGHRNTAVSLILEVAKS